MIIQDLERIVNYFTSTPLCYSKTTWQRGPSLALPERCRTPATGCAATPSRTRMIVWRLVFMSRPNCATNVRPFKRSTTTARCSSVRAEGLPNTSLRLWIHDSENAGPRNPVLPCQGTHRLTRRVLRLHLFTFCGRGLGRSTEYLTFSLCTCQSGLRALHQQ